MGVNPWLWRREFRRVVRGYGTGRKIKGDALAWFSDYLYPLSVFINQGKKPAIEEILPTWERKNNK
jgi:hypothetical protein